MNSENEQPNNGNVATDIEHVEVAALEPTALEAMERATIDTQITTAKRYPRSLSVFLKRAEEMVSVDEETAKSCMYSRPVGKKGNQIIYAQGESIRMAEIVAACYGNLRVQAIITEMTARYVKSMGIAHDLESNYAVKAEVVESTVDRHGRPYSERQRIVVAKAAQSKALRDAIFRVVPKSLCKSLSFVSKEIALGKGQTLECRRKKLMEWIDSVGVEPERIFMALGVEGINDIGNDHLITLTGVRTALKDRDISIDEAFPQQEIPESKIGVEALKSRLAKNDKKSPEKKPDPKFEKKKAEQIKKIKEVDEKARTEKDELKKYHCNSCGLDFAPEDIERNDNCPKCLSKDIKK